MADNNRLEIKWANAVVFDTGENKIFHIRSLGQVSLENARRAIQDWEENKGYIILSYWITDDYDEIIESKVLVEPNFYLRDFSGHTSRLSTVQEYNEKYREY